MREMLKKIKPCNMESPYIFISYSTADAEVVYRDVLRFQKLGYNIWLDEVNLDKTKASWKDDAIKAIEDIDCELVVFYVSRNSLKSVPCYNEMLSIYSDKAIAYHLEPVKFIAVEAEPIDNMKNFVTQIHGEVRHSNASKKERQEQTATINGFFTKFFNSNNEKVRIKTKDASNRKLDYYEEITAYFPNEVKVEDAEMQYEGRDDDYFEIGVKQNYSDVFDEDFEQSYFYQRNNNFESRRSPSIRCNGKKPPLTDIEVTVVRAMAIEDVKELVKVLQEGHTVILNLQTTDWDISQQIIDQISGYVYASEGRLQGISRGIYLVTPKGIEISGELLAGMLE